MWVNNSLLIIYWNVNQCRSVMFHSSLTLSLSRSLLSLSLSLSPTVLLSLPHFFTSSLFYHSFSISLSLSLTLSLTLSLSLSLFLSLSLPPSLSLSLPNSVHLPYTISHLLIFRCIKTENCPNFHSYLKQLQQFSILPSKFLHCSFNHSKSTKCPQNLSSFYFTIYQTRRWHWSLLVKYPSDLENNTFIEFLSF